MAFTELDDPDEPEADGLRPLVSTDDGRIAAEELTGRVLMLPVEILAGELEGEGSLEDGDWEELEGGSLLALLVGIAGLAVGNTVEDGVGDVLAGVRRGLLAEKEDNDSAGDLLGLTAGVFTDGLEAIALDEGDVDSLLEEIETGTLLGIDTTGGEGVRVEAVVQQTSVVSSMLSTPSSIL